jgi:hypothetical protein
MTMQIIRFAAVAALLLSAACTESATASNPGAAYGSSERYPWENRAFRGQPNP